ncbi:hypothetical protein CEXT_249571 [Caerostris extrusa]|uniref:Uncharacterized protein n=1 Tax=Caerostris extrusa TaxID=172846 RepID=A0AAV4UI72_CAEEX|nr:hypothetical protein CEXT_249571 [Caerostris extrusa]
MQSSSRDAAQMRVAQEDGKSESCLPSTSNSHTHEKKKSIAKWQYFLKRKWPPTKRRAFLPNPATPANVTGNGRGDRDSPSGRHAAPPDRRMDHPSMSVHQTALLPI